MPSKLSTLVGESRLEEAIDLLKNHPKFDSDNQYTTAVIMISGQWYSIQADEMTVTQEYARMQKARISNSILATARRYKIEEVSDEDPKTPDPVVAPIPKPGVPQILFLASNPREVGKLNLAEEFAKIRTQLGNNAVDFNLNIIYDQRPDTLSKTLKKEKPTYIHFAGHGDKGLEGFNPAGIVLQDRYGNPQIVSGLALANMFRLLKKEFEIKVVLLNACDSMEMARTISGNGIHTIGMAKEIPDNMAITFAGGFYLGLADSPDDIPGAFDWAMSSLMMEGYDIDTIPRLFLNKEEVKSS